MASQYNDNAKNAKSATGKMALVSIVGAAAAAIMVPLVAGFEGKRNDPYADLIGKMTVCYGETRVEMRRYSNAECNDMLANGLADFAAPVIARNPELKGNAPQLAAAVSLAYNIGISNYRKSTVARRFSEGRWRQACDAFLSWSYAGGRQVQGLLNRRREERQLCLRGIA
ncbi:lysozyme [Novosphingobium sp.]|uniref:lysozyme n=1 Tax=Novosphingobium sp. TaxID=1874826 RepID=UPI00260267C1|nr:lysozyme [Novosphingobium sp.]